MKVYRWGLVGTGKICRSFCKALSLLKNAEVSAVCSRSMEKAKGFAEEFNIPAAYDSVEDMAGDENVDIVYIGTPHVNHADIALAAIDKGKAVLCEKPLSINAKQASAAIEAAKAKKVFLMEGMWTRFLPTTQQVYKWISDGRIGKVREVNASFFHKTPYDKSDRTIAVELGGGALLDLGVYPIFLAQWLLGGRPNDISSCVTRCENGIDWQSSATMKFCDGGMATISCGFEYDSNHAEIAGDDGMIVIPDFNCASSAYLVKGGMIEDKYSDSSSVAQKYGFEASHVMQCLDQGLTQSSLYPLWQTYDILDTCDRLRASWKLSYPTESHIPVPPNSKSAVRAVAAQVKANAPQLSGSSNPSAKDWYRDAAFYHIYPLGFCGENRGNDFISKPSDKIRRLIPFAEYLEKLGANAVYFGPLFESSRHGYDTADYRVVDRRLGTNADLAEVCGELHKRGIRMIFDGVFNHVGRDFWAFNDVKQNKWDSPYKDWFNISFDGNSNYNDGFWYEGWEGHYDLVKLNLKNPAVKDHIFSCIEGWVKEFDIDGLRLDVAYCLDTDFLRELHSFCKGLKDDFFLLGECLHGDYNTWCNDAMLDSVTNYECYKGLYSSFNSANMHEIGYSVNRQFADEQWSIYKGKNLYTFVDNHDVTRVASILTDKANLPLIYSLMFAMPGIPSVYYGSEFAMQGDKHQGDDALRPEMSKELAESSANALTEHIRRLYAVRGSSQALCRGSYKQLHANANQLIFRREYNGEKIIFALNADNSPYVAHFNAEAGRAKDLITGVDIDFGGGLNIPAKTAYIARVF